MPEGDANGRFTKGYKGGPGRPPRRTESEYLNITANKVPLNQWQRVVQKALKDALDGDKHARRWLSDFLIGRPATTELVAGVDSELLELLIEAIRAADHEPEEVFLNMLNRLDQTAEVKWNERRQAAR